MQAALTPPDHAARAGEADVRAIRIRQRTFSVAGAVAAAVIAVVAVLIGVRPPATGGGSVDAAGAPASEAVVLSTGPDGSVTLMTITAPVTTVGGRVVALAQIDGRTVQMPVVSVMPTSGAAVSTGAPGGTAVPSGTAAPGGVGAAQSTTSASADILVQGTSSGTPPTTTSPRVSSTPSTPVPNQAPSVARPSPATPTSGNYLPGAGVTSIGVPGTSLIDTAGPGGGAVTSVPPIGGAPIGGPAQTTRPAPTTSTRPTSAPSAAAGTHAGTAVIPPPAAAPPVVSSPKNTPPPGGTSTSTTISCPSIAVSLPGLPVVSNILPTLPLPVPGCP